MRPILLEARSPAALVIIAASMLSGCASLISNAASGLADNLTSAILNQDDPETVRAGMPSYMLLMDSFVEGSPDDPAMLGAAANLYASYGAVFAEDEARASRLTKRAREYALRGICRSYTPSCAWRDLNYDDFVATLDGLTPAHSEAVYLYSFATLAYLRAHAADWNSLAELPQAEALIRRYFEISGKSVKSSAHVYMGIILTLRPPSLGGKPEEARIHFEKAIAMSAGKDLSAKVEFAKGYAKLLYERELHDTLVGEVLEASPYADGLTLMNVLAQEEALILRAEANDYF
ncbi:MAG: TRAP transporter TatT component family protein [Gammaproteobacteria bacterium]|nr:TRAP transporter TatT component family protein [Gammaproteobacteria bacterium]MDH3371978.1 TRAP transporter TatT component family protein [Gammaproteobacteria bacterium]